MRSGLVFSILMLLAACSSDPGTGPVEVKWDRDVCQRCNMVLSDRFHAAQIRYTPANQASQVHKFDDIGCALLWLEQQPESAEVAVEIWVNDHRNGEWIDARTAHYVTQQITPMGYGLGAQVQAGSGTLTFSEAKAHIDTVEHRHNTHGAHLKQNTAVPHVPSSTEATLPPAG